MAAIGGHGAKAIETSPVHGNGFSAEQGLGLLKSNAVTSVIPLLHRQAGRLQVNINSGLFRGT